METGHLSALNADPLHGSATSRTGSAIPSVFALPFPLRNDRAAVQSRIMSCEGMARHSATPCPSLFIHATGQPNAHVPERRTLLFRNRLQSLQNVLRRVFVAIFGQSVAKPIPQAVTHDIVIVFMTPVTINHAVISPLKLGVVLRNCEQDISPILVISAELKAGMPQIAAIANGRINFFMSGCPCNRCYSSLYCNNMPRFQRS